MEDNQTLEQSALEGIPWEEEIGQAFGNTDPSIISEPMPVFNDAETIKKRPKLALILAGAVPIVIFILAWGAHSFVVALGNITEKASNQRRQNPIVAENPWELEAAELKGRLSKKNQREQIEAFNQKAKATKKKPTTPAPQPRAVPPPPRRSTPPRIAAPKVIYRDKPPTPKAAPPSPRPIPKAVPKPRPTPKRSTPTPRAPLRIAASRPRVAPKAEPQLSATEKWNQLSQFNTIGESGNSQNLAFDVDESGIVQYQAEQAQAPARFPTGLSAEAKLLDSLSFQGIASLPASLELQSPLGEIPTGSIVSAIASISDGTVTFKLEGYEAISGYEPISDAQIMAIAPAKLKGGGNGNSLLGDVLGIGADLLKDGTGQSVSFDGRGNISSIDTKSSNGTLDKLIGSGSEVLSERFKSRSNGKARYFKLKKNTTVTLMVRGN